MLDPEEWLLSWVTTIEAQVVGCQGAGDPPKKNENFFCPLYVMFLRRGPGTKQKNHKVRRGVQSGLSNFGKSRVDHRSQI